MKLHSSSMWSRRRSSASSRRHRNGVRRCNCFVARPSMRTAPFSASAATPLVEIKMLATATVEAHWKQLQRMKRSPGLCPECGLLDLCSSAMATVVIKIKWVISADDTLNRSKSNSRSDWTLCLVHREDLSTFQSSIRFMMSSHQQSPIFFQLPINGITYYVRLVQISALPVCSLPLIAIIFAHFQRAQVEKWAQIKVWIKCRNNNM